MARLRRNSGNHALRYRLRDQALHFFASSPEGGGVDAAPNLAPVGREPCHGRGVRTIAAGAARPSGKGKTAWNDL